MKRIPVSLAVEGVLDEVVLRQLIEQSGPRFEVTACYGKRGKDHLRQNISRFNQAAVHKPFIILTDLDDEDCPPGLISRWLPSGPHCNLILRIAVREVESWLVADAERFARFLGVGEARLPQWPDLIPDPKADLVQLARRSRKRDIREDLIPASGSTSKVGRNYAGQLIQFASGGWTADAAACQRSPSLRKGLLSLRKFSPRIPA
ncbi:MAG: hypothetical protein ABSF95_17250 [Verrucomicrobiota bacterium]